MVTKIIIITLIISHLTMIKIMITIIIEMIISHLTMIERNSGKSIVPLASMLISLNRSWFFLFAKQFFFSKTFKTFMSASEGLSPRDLITVLSSFAMIVPSPV